MAFFTRTLLRVALSVRKLSDARMRLKGSESVGAESARAEKKPGDSSVRTQLHSYGAAGQTCAVLSNAQYSFGRKLQLQLAPMAQEQRQTVIITATRRKPHKSAQRTCRTFSRARLRACRARKVAQGRTAGVTSRHHGRKPLSASKERASKNSGRWLAQGSILGLARLRRGKGCFLCDKQEPTQRQRQRGSRHAAQ